MSRALMRAVDIGISSQGWQIVGIGGSWAKAVEPIEAHIQRRIDKAVKAERERCAKVADHHARRNYPWGSENTDIYHAQAHWAERIAAAIRAGGKQG